MERVVRQTAYDSPRAASHDVPSFERSSARYRPIERERSPAERSHCLPRSGTQKKKTSKSNDCSASSCLLPKKKSIRVGDNSD